MIIRLDRTLLRVAGEDALSFLQGLLTQNLETLPPGASAYAGLLSPQGKVIADMIVWRERNDAFLLDLAANRAEAVLKRLLLYKLRAKLTIERLQGLSVFAVLGETRPALAPLMTAVDPRFPDGSYGERLIGDGPWDDDPAAYEAVRLQLGVPDLARDAGADEVFALEALFEELHGVDFHKGCFVGQETTSRMKRRGTVKTRFLPVAFDGPPPTPGAEILAGELRAGEVLSVGEGLAMASLRLDRIEGAELSSGGVALRVLRPDWFAAALG